jgi:ribonuclease HII
LGFGLVAGIDEVGRGCLAGPVVAAAVILRGRRGLEGVNDSKLLTPARREELMRRILRHAAAWSLGSADAGEIDAINILNATRLAMERAVAGLPARPDHLLIDAVMLRELPMPQTSIIKGDRISMSIAAASIVAKVSRDRLMEYYDRLYPGFGFASHKGYGTPEHLRAVSERGPCPLHRVTFSGVPPGASLGH